MTIYQFVTKARDANGSEYRNIHHYEFFNYQPDASQLQEAVDYLDGAYKTHLQGAFHDDIEVYEYDFRRVDVGDLPTQTLQATAGSWSGTSSTDKLAPQLAALVTFRANTFYPRTTRSYLFPFAENNNSASGALSPGLQTSLSSWGNAILELDVTGDTNPDKVAVQYGGDPRAVVDHNSLFTVSVGARWATQRRRKVGRGI